MSHIPVVVDISRSKASIKPTKGNREGKKVTTFVRTRYSVWLLVKSPTLCGSPTVMSNDAFAAGGVGILLGVCL